MDKKSMTAIVVEDLADARENIKDIISNRCPEIKLIGEAENIIEAAKLLAKEMPDILFLDIELGSHTAFDLLDMVPNLTSKIIFTTASSEYAIKAFRYAAMDYLMKPIDPDELVESVKKMNLFSNELQQDQLEIIRKEEGEPLSKIALHTMEMIHVIDVSKIMRCAADGNYSKFFIEGKSPILVTRTLKEYDKLLADQGFMRVHQSHLVNENYIEGYVKVDGGYLQMKDGSKIPVSTRKKSQVVAALSELG